MPEALLEVEGLTIEYVTEAADVRAVEDVSFSVHAGEFVGIVGESGCGKSTMLFGIAQLLSPPGEVAAGRVIFRGKDMVRLSAGELRHMRWRDYSVVMQSAMNALNPMKSIGAQFKDAFEAHERMSNDGIAERSAEVLALVGIDPAHLKSYPHQLSGGMRQRAMIAMALLFTPQLVVMDEPTSALDVVAQRSLMTKIRELQEQLGFAVIFVTHDMHVVSRYSDRVLVMYAGQIVESATTEQIFAHPQHPYSRGLIEAFPSVTGRAGSCRYTRIAARPGGYAAADAASSPAARWRWRSASTTSRSCTRSMTRRSGACSTRTAATRPGRVAARW